MNVKRYIANDVQEAMQKIRMELGRDAVILHTRKIKQKGIKGWFSKPLVEVIAAIDQQEKTLKPSQSQQSSSDQYLREATQVLLAERAKELEKARELENQRHSEKIEVLERENQWRLQSDSVHNPALMPINGTRPSADHQEITLLKSQMMQLTEMMEKIVEKVNQPQPIPSHSSIPSIPSHSSIPPILNETNGTQTLPIEQEDDNHTTKDIKIKLEKQLVLPETISKILTVLARQSLAVGDKESAMKNATRGIVRDMIGLPYRIDLMHNAPQIYFFIGPTGVGKTTTLAKIAAKLSLVDGKKVGLVTSDTYRIAAVDQLKTYSEILSMPLEVIYEASELQSVLRKFQDRDFVLIDTAGRNHKSPELQDDLQSLLNYAPSAELFLVISLTTGFQDIESILNSYQFISDYKLIFTKIDEAASFGNILNTRLLANKPIAFLTNGQSVPDDITISDGDKIAALLVGD